MKSTRWFVTLAVALVMGVSSAQGASKPKTHSQTAKNKVHQMLAPNGDIIESLIAISPHSPGCYLKYQRKHSKSDYNKNVFFNMMCCETSGDPKKQCCDNKGGDAAKGFEIGCEPLLGDPNRAWINSADMKKISDRSCEIANQCQTGGLAIAAGSVVGFAAGGAAFLGGNVMGGTACMVGSGVGLAAGIKSTVVRERELRECSKVTDIRFKPDTTLRFEQGNIRDSAVLLRKIMLKAREEAHRTDSVLQESATHLINNAEVMVSPEVEGVKTFLKEAEERTGTIIPQPLTPGSQQ